MRPSTLALCALFVACQAHAPAPAPCSLTVYDFEDDASSRCPFVEADRRGDYVSPEAEGPSPPLPPSDRLTSRPETAARQIKAAIEACDRAKVRDRFLGYQELSSLATTPVAQDAYAQLLEEASAMHLQGLCEQSSHSRLSDPKIDKVQAVPAGGEWKRPFALVTVTLLDEAQRPSKPRPPLSLVELDGDWWILPRMPRR